MLEKKYNPQEVENGKYEIWKEKGYFESGRVKGNPFTIVIPTPNVTGKLHLGHAWDTTLQDIMIRYKRMQGYDALWLPGMDHAGIATQAKVEARMREEGISRYDLGREGFLERAWDWKKEYGSTIVKVDPLPYSLLAQMKPLCCLTISFAMDKPSPVPP